MITDKDRIDFLQQCIEDGEVTCFNFYGGARAQIDKEMIETGAAFKPDFYCDCGIGFCDQDMMDGSDGNLPCVHSTEIFYHQNGQETWTSTYQCPGCGKTLDFEESN